jgi:glutamine cyclotransferase
LLRWDLHSGRILNEVTLDPHYFGEGVTVLDGTVYQLTYLSNIGFTYDLRTLRRTGSFQYPTQGWGLTNDGKRLLMSDGSSAIFFLDPHSFRTEGHIYVSDNVGRVGFLNELEYAGGKIYANVWKTDFIAIIDPATGKVTGWIDLASLNPNTAALAYPDVLNGIAYDKITGDLIVTGKCWPNLYDIKLVARSAKSP